MHANPSFAVVLEGGCVKDIIVQDWPRHLPLPAFAVVDYDIDDATDEDIVRFTIAGAAAEALCHKEPVEVFESIPRALSPRDVLATLGEPVTDGMPEPLEVARSVRQSILELDAQINAAEQSPTGGDYDHLYVLANCGLIDVLKLLGDPTDFGD